MNYLLCDQISFLKYNNFIKLFKKMLIIVRLLIVLFINDFLSNLEKDLFWAKIKNKRNHNIFIVLFNFSMALAII